MIGKPKFQRGDKVKFTWTRDGQEISKTGSIYIVDAYGTFEQNNEVSYDIFVEEENCLYKHFVESMVEGIEEQ